jgi:hypothetical protein
MVMSSSMKYFNTLFHYDIVSNIHLYHLSYVCELNPSAHMRCIWFLLKTLCDTLSPPILSSSLCGASPWSGALHLQVKVLEILVVCVNEGGRPPFIASKGGSRHLFRWKP